MDGRRTGADRSGRLFASNKHAPACLFRQSPNAKGSAESRSALGFLWSRQQCSRRAAALHRFLGLSLRSCFAPVVCLQHTRFRVHVSAKRERQRKRGEPLRAWVLMVKTTMFAACRRSASFSWTFGVAPLVAALRLLKGRSVGKALPHFHNEPYVTLHPRRGFAYISHKTRLF